MNASDSNINLNAANCLRSATDIGVTHVHNICNNTIVDVPWGTADWLGALAIGGFAVATITIFVGLGVMMFRA